MQPFLSSANLDGRSFKFLRHVRRALTSPSTLFHSVTVASPEARDPARYSYPRNAKATDPITNPMLGELSLDEHAGEIRRIVYDQPVAEGAQAIKQFKVRPNERGRLMARWRD